MLLPPGAGTIWNVNSSPTKSGTMCSPRISMGQSIIGLGTQLTPTRRNVSPTKLATIAAAQLDFETRNREAVRIRASGTTVSGFNNIKTSPERNRCRSGSANGGEGMLVEPRHQRPNKNKTVPNTMAHTVNHSHLPTKCSACIV